MRYFLRKIFSLPPHMMIKKVVGKAYNFASNNLFRLIDNKFQTYQKDSYSKLHPLAFRISKSIKNRLTDISFLPIVEIYLEHGFDLLGSGWVQVYHGMKCRGLEGYRYDMGTTLTIDEQGQWLTARINSSNLAESQRICQLVDSEYIPIDWHIDFKSGYRWSEKTWYKDIKFGHKLGVDIKVPWELARMQHLPQLAIAYANFKSQVLSFKNERENSVIFSENQKNQHRLEDPKKYVREFRNQVLDFISTNPPRFGVNWVCAMDVAIRAANWIMAYDLFSASGAQYDKEFEAVFTRSIYEHGLHIVNNLEWYDQQQRGNHYLADIAGLAFIAAFLPSTKETDAWLAFAVQELVTEVGHQFYPDGGNFEGSTAYHRLSAEMVYFATALILGLPSERWKKLRSYDHKTLKTGWGKPSLKPSPLPFYRLPEGSRASQAETPFPPWYFERMERMAEFIMDITKPNGHIPQIGDNDSGRFFKLGPKYERMTAREAKDTYANLDGYDELPDDADYFMENHLDCSHLLAGAYGLFDRKDFAQWLGGIEKASIMPDCLTIRALANRVTIGSQRFSQRRKENNDFFTIGTEEDFEKALSEIQSKPENQVRIIEFPVQSGDLRNDLTLRAYPDFGLYLYTSPRLYLAIRCWPGHKPFRTSHMHDDQLSIELELNGHSVFCDPGSYIYTPLPSERCLYRSKNSHFSPLNRNEKLESISKSLFESIQLEKMRVGCFRIYGFIARSIPLFHQISFAILIQKESIWVYKYSNMNKSNKSTVKNGPSFSPGYGLKSR